MTNNTNIVWSLAHQLFLVPISILTVTAADSRLGGPKRDVTGRAASPAAPPQLAPA